MASPTYTPRLLPARLPRVCVAITGSDPVEMIDKAEAVVRENPFLEFRLDYLRKPAAALQLNKRFTDYYPHALVVATSRRPANGGKFRGPAAPRMAENSAAPSPPSSTCSSRPRTTDVSSWISSCRPPTRCARRISPACA